MKEREIGIGTPVRHATEDLGEGKVLDIYNNWEDGGQLYYTVEFADGDVVDCLRNEIKAISGP